MDFRSTLILGLGGTGSSIAQAVYQQAEAAGLTQKGQIAVLAIDTDDNDMQALKGLDVRSKVRFSTPQPVYNILRDNPEVERDWFLPPAALTNELRNLSLIDGAGQIRMLTRLALHAGFKKGLVKNDLQRVINSLTRFTNKDSFDGTLNILIIGTLAGATGCGSFLQIALAARQIAREACHVKNPQVRGLFLLPDILVRAASLPKDQKAYVRANAYAALRELNAITQFTAGRQGAQPLDFEFMPGTQLRDGGIPFEALTLIDYENLNGQNLGKDLNHYKEMATRAAYTLLFTPIGQRFASVSINNILTKIEKAATGNTNLYSAIGVTEITYPETEMLDYLSRRFALETLEGDWLQLDRLYQRRLQSYQERRESGDLSAQLAPQDESYLTDLNQLHRERRPFFIEIHQQIYPEIEESNGEIRVEPQYLTLLDHFVAHMQRSFRQHKSDISQVYQRAPITSSSFEDRLTLSDDVRRRERSLDKDWRILESAARDFPDEIYDNSVTAAEAMNPEEWQSYHLQTFLVKSSPHPVQARYFLYALGVEIKKRLEKLDVAGRRQAVLLAAALFDPEKQATDSKRGSRQIIALAEEISNAGFFSKLMGKDLSGFRKKYSHYYNVSLDLMRQYAEAMLLEKTYSRLLADIQGLGKLLELLFAELENLRGDLKGQVEEMLDQHTGARSAGRGILYTCADREAKEALWQDVYAASATLRQSRSANHQLIDAIFNAHRDNRRQRRGKKAGPPFSARTLFTEAVVDGFCRQRIQKELHDRYGMNVVQAIRREAEIRGLDWQSHFKALVEIASGQSDPFISLVDEHAGDLIMFWAVSPTLKTEINDDHFFESLFTFQQGENAVIREEFPDKTLACINTRVNLTLQDLEKLHPGDPENNHIHAPMPGRYEAAYRERIQRLIDWQARHPDQVSPEITPHLDRDWHLPGQLPEIFPHLDQRHQARIFQALAIGLAMGWLERSTSHGEKRTDWCDPTAAGSGFNRRPLVDSHLTEQILDKIEASPEIALIIPEHWQSVKQAPLDKNGHITATFTAIDTICRLSDPVLVLSLLEPVRNRSRKDGRERASLALKALLTALIDLVQIHSSQLDDLAQRHRFQQLRTSLQTNIQQQLTTPPYQTLPEETRRDMRDIADNLLLHAEKNWPA